MDDERAQWLSSFVSMRPTPDKQKIRVRVFVEFSVRTEFLPEDRIVRVTLLDTDEVPAGEEAQAMEIAHDALGMPKDRLLQLVMEKYFHSYKIEDPRMSLLSVAAE